MDTTVSASDIDDVQAANIASRKNAAPMAWPAGMDSKTRGMVWNMSPGPSEIPTPLNITTAGTIMRPDRKATEVSIRLMVWAERSMFTFLRM